MSTSNDDHASLEALSAFLDGEAPEWTAHLEACRRCRGELSRVREVAAAVGGPVAPPPPRSIDDAVARAMDAAGPVPGVVPADPSSPTRRPRLPLVAVVSGSIAAVLLSVLAGVAVLGGDGGDRGADTALAPRPEAAEDGTTAAGAPASQAAPGGDLGEVGDPAALAARLAGRIPGTAGGPVAMAARPEGGGGPSQSAASRMAVPCEAEARAADPRLGKLVYVATGQRDGRPVVVLGFGAAPVTVVVMASEGCAPVLSTEVP